MNHTPFSGTEVTGNIAAVPLDLAAHVDDLEVTRLLVRSDKMLAKKITYQCV